jgi:hypothetical protein
MTPRLSISRIKLAEYANNRFSVVVDHNHSIDNLLKPEYWSHVSRQPIAFKAFDRIEARSEDGTWLAELLILDAGDNWAKVKLLNVWDLAADVPQETSVIPDFDHPGYDVRWRGPVALWGVVRLDDKVVLVTGLKAKDDAKLWLSKHLQKVAA